MLVSYLVVFWAQSTTKDYIRAETNFNLSPIYSSRKSSNHKFPKNHKISPNNINVQIYNKTYTNTKHNIFKKLVPLVLPLLKKKKHINLEHTGIVNHSIDLSIPDFQKV